MAWAGEGDVQAQVDTLRIRHTELAEKTARLAESAEARIAALEKCYGKDSVSVGLERLSQRFAALEAKMVVLEEWAADGGPVHGFTLEGKE